MQKRIMLVLAISLLLMFFVGCNKENNIKIENQVIDKIELLATSDKDKLLVANINNKKTVLDYKGNLTQESEDVALLLQETMGNEEPNRVLSSPDTLKKLSSIKTNNVIISQRNATSISSRNTYTSNTFLSVFMWLHTMGYCSYGLYVIFSGTFVGGTFLMAAGLIMCPLISKTIRFLPRFVLMLLLLIVSSFFYKNPLITRLGNNDKIKSATIVTEETTKTTFIRDGIAIIGEYEQDNDTENGPEPIRWLATTAQPPDMPSFTTAPQPS